MGYVFALVYAVIRDSSVKEDADAGRLMTWPESSAHVLSNTDTEAAFAILYKCTVNASFSAHGKSAFRF